MAIFVSPWNCNEQKDKESTSTTGRKILTAYDKVLTYLWHENTQIIVLTYWY